MHYREVLDQLSLKRETVLVAYSGGKDSTYVLNLLAEHEIPTIAYMIDNSFIAKKAIKNAFTVSRALNSRLIIDVLPVKNIRGDFNRAVQGDLYSDLQKRRASDICNTCMYHINRTVIQYALIHGIRYISGGYLEGQVPKTGCLSKIPIRLHLQAMHNQEILLYGEQRSPIVESPPDFIYSFNPLLEIKVHEHDILRSIERLGWEKPKTTGLNSSNCLLNDFAIKTHLKKYGINPYEIEIKNQVKNKTIDSEEAEKRIHYNYDLVEDVEL